MLDRAIELAVLQQNRMMNALQAGMSRADFYAQPEEQQTSVLINDMLIIYNDSRTTV